ncbi:hypothetical protein [Jeotgalibacillus haloalkalitolerans]|uniref:Uncharacterized protein n=1 Tax=Jeotgalibacillus haloalkalitolerans TaxID=3104292 RepID=A0ABU5KJE8_9BACL|nr:hypothetical protein [Jeotgalibacillus sp. HH7-29]MDZ5711379.1 hypothetical protein [Jeotgalibacillus sp. HH7-29]
MSHNIDFQYTYTSGDSWASGCISTEHQTFEFTCSYLFHNPFEELLNAVYQIVPNLAAFPRKEIHFTMLDEPLEYRWEFRLIDDTHVRINIYEKVYDSKTKLVFQDNCNLFSLLKALTKCIANNPELRGNENIERINKEFKVYLKNG